MCERIATDRTRRWGGGAASAGRMVMTVSEEVESTSRRPRSRLVVGLWWLFIRGESVHICVACRLPYEEGREAKRPSARRARGAQVGQVPRASPHNRRSSAPCSQPEHVPEPEHTDARPSALGSVSAANPAACGAALGQRNCPPCLWHPAATPPHPQLSDRAN